MRFGSIFSILAIALYSQLSSAAGITRVTVKGLQYLHNLPAPVSSSEGLLHAEHERKFRITRGLEFQFHPFIQASSLSLVRGQQLFFDPREMFIEYRRRSTFVRAGFVTMKWEGTDGLNPMDIATMKDWSDPLGSQTRASGGVHFGKSGDDYDFDAAWIPEQTISLLPGEKSPWLPRKTSLPLRTEDVELRLPDRVEYSYLARQEIKDARLNAVAMRFQYRASFGDFALAGYEGLSDMPMIKPEPEVTPIVVGPPKSIYLLLSPVKLRPIDYRNRTVAAFASTTLGEWIFRVAGKYDQPVRREEEFGRPASPHSSDRILPSWSQSTVFGAERTFQLGPNGVTTVLQGSLVKRPEESGLLSIADVFDQTLLYGVRYPVGEDWTFFVSGFNSLKNSSYFTKHEIGYRITDHWRSDFAIELLDGPSDTLLGILGENDRATLSFTGTY